MKKIALSGLLLSAFIVGCSPKEAAKDPCKEKNVVFSNYLIQKCYGHYMEQIEENTESINKLSARVDNLEERVSKAEQDIQGLKEEVDKLKISGKEQVRVYFDFDKFTLREDARTALDDLIDAVRDKDIKKVIVVGYADPKGKEGYNFELSMKRAQNVAAYLIRNGLPVEKIRIAAYGEELADLIGERDIEQRAVDVIVLY
ncbi:OmpA family protein [Aquifex pyrophilus]